MTSSHNSKKFAAVTGATGAIGQAIVTGLVQKDFQVVLLVRDHRKAVRLISQLKESYNQAELDYRLVDISSQSDIKSLANSWDIPLHVLVNNAAVSPPSREETEKGIELQFATNVLGYYWMIKYFSDILRSSAPARVVNIASYWAGGLDLSDLEFKTRQYHNHDAYRQSKQANRMLTPIMANQFDPARVTVNSCHPGDVNSKLSNDLGFGGSQSPADGAMIPIWLASSNQLSDITGRYFESRDEINCPFSSNEIESEKLFKICQTYQI
jgi:NAD(P)-dependent dehydrogenase (short-subunit alcohol dehydrogenase family)